MSKHKIQQNKIRIAILLTFILAIIVGKNVLERRSFNDLGKSFISVYEDRLVVEGYIFSISENLFRIKLLVNHCELESDYSNVIGEIETLEEKILAVVEDFEKTGLTANEAIFLTDFRTIIEENLRIVNYDLLYSDSDGINLTQVRSYNESIEQALIDLEKLSQIQMEEGKRLADEADRVVNKSKIWAQFELVALIVLALIIYLLLYTKRTINSEFLQ
ncbi:MCP four helix bundle domain-containing protein [Mongoliitalea daihaiensis]|uniref:MCP four helix bundle domain-containing protein n=1 Tax=Mongoliitalea daihaiensis TaxID=2782006 RepID=UPI001F267FF9|nr:MCP four helix bundle domain-containing protein [Mongoliitalea daihaiensis]UJP65239.1 MCP four helix bundle domain-containing protein [Mongoliitalea daihaiensis]